MFSLPCDASAVDILSPTRHRHARTISLGSDAAFSERTPERSSSSELTTAPDTPRDLAGVSLCHGAGDRALPSTPESLARAPPGLCLTAACPSAGSVLHATGQCRPCGWFWKPQGCQNGTACGHCHLCPPDEVKVRKLTKAAMVKSSLSIAMCSDNVAAGNAKELPSPALQPLLPPLLHLSTLLLSVGVPLPPPVPSALIATTPQLLSSPLQSFTTLDPPAPPSESPRLMLPIEHSQTPPPLSCPSSPLAAQPLLLQYPRLTLNLSKEIRPSVGSTLHREGRCTACAWFWKPQGCGNGQDCSYCHLCPPGEIRRRRKLKNAALRAQAATNNEAIASESAMPSVEPLPAPVHIFQLLL